MTELNLVLDNLKKKIQAFRSEHKKLPVRIFPMKKCRLKPDSGFQTAYVFSCSRRQPLAYPAAI